MDLRLRCPALAAAFATLTLLAVAPVMAQHDSLRLSNGDLIVGELKTLDAGVAVIETPYSKNDFTIEWDGVRKIATVNRFIVTLQNGDRLTGTIRSGGGDAVVIEDTALGSVRNVSLLEIVLLKGVEDDFWSRLRANVDFGLNVQKEHNLVNFTSNSMVGYLVERWEVTLSYNATRSTQDSVADIERTEGVANLVYLLPRDWYVQTSVTGLSNTEQALDLRLQGRLSLGKYLIHTNRAYLRAGAGLSQINEQYFTDTLDKSSLEGVLGAELSIFDIGDLTLGTMAYAYPGFTEKGRWRVDFDFNVKYDLLEDFYVKFTTTVNYDNRPAVAGAETYYVYGFSVGWELE